MLSSGDATACPVASCELQGAAAGLDPRQLERSSRRCPPISTDSTPSRANWRPAERILAAKPLRARNLAASRPAPVRSKCTRRRLASLSRELRNHCCSVRTSEIADRHAAMAQYVRYRARHAVPMVGDPADLSDHRRRDGSTPSARMWLSRGGLSAALLRSELEAALRVDGRKCRFR